MTVQKKTIHGAFLDIIQRINSDKEYKVNIPEWFNETEVTVDSNDTRADIINYFNSCISFSIEDGYIVFVLKRSEEDIEKFKSDSTKRLNYNLKELKSKCDKKLEYKEEIYNYLTDHPKYGYILDMMKNIM